MNQHMNSNMKHIDVPNISGVYLLTDTVTGATYVGSARRVRMRVSGHFCDMVRRPEGAAYRVFGKTFAAHGAKAFTAALLEACDTAVLLAREKYWIDRVQPSENSYVCTDGRRVYNDDTCARKAAAAAALWTDPVYRERAVAARQGNTYSKGYKCTPEQKLNRQRAGRIANMKRNHGDAWVAAYLQRYPQHAGDVNGCLRVG